MLSNMGVWFKIGTAGSFLFQQNSQCQCSAVDTHSLQF